MQYILCFVSFLVQSDELKECLSNPHVRDILKSLVQSQTPETSIKEAMKEPIFLVLAHGSCMLENCRARKVPTRIG